MDPGEWESKDRRILVRTETGEPALWLENDGELHDAIGTVRVYESGAGRAADLDAGEIAVFVAEWLACCNDRDGPTALGDIHPQLRALVYELTPSAIVVTDDDAFDVMLS